MSLFNSTDLISVTGYVAKSEMRYTNSGVAVLSLNIPVDRSYVKDGNKTERTIWYNVKVWGKLAETVNKWIDKGALVQVVGELEPDYETGNPRTYQRNDGTTAASYEIKARDATILRKAETKQVMPPPENDPPF